MSCGPSRVSPEAAPARQAAPDLVAAFKGARILVTGGFGFIGSTLAHRLAALGAAVRLIDCLDPDSGANRANLAGIEHRIDATIGDIRDGDAMARAIAGCHYLFDLAGRTSHLGSMQAPLADFDVNARAQLAVLEICRTVNPGIRIVFASTRQIYGRPDYLPVDEKHPLRPVDVNGVSKMAGEAFHSVYHHVYEMRTTALRLTNTYGPRMRIKDGRQTFVGVWLRAVLEGRPFEVWDGAQIRDFTYVEDAAEAFLLAAATPAAEGDVFNIGGAGAVRLRDLAAALVEANRGGSFAIKEFPAERKRIDIGDYYADDSRFRHATGWQPRTNLGDGLKKTLEFFRARLAQYV